MMGGLDDPDEEKSLRRAFLSILSSPISNNPIPILGDISEAIGSALTGNYAPWTGKYPIGGDAYKLGKFGISVFDGEFLKSMKEAAGIAGDLTGYPMDTLIDTANDMLIGADILEK